MKIFAVNWVIDYNSGEITDDILDAHVKRILIMKLEFGIIK